MKNELINLKAFQIAKLLKEKKTDPVALLEIYIDQYFSLTSKTKDSFVEIFKEEAMKEAEKSWKRQVNGSRLGLFDGIPVAYKDVIDIKGYPAYGGSKLLKKIRKNKRVNDAEVVVNAKKAGIISLAKTCTVEFAFGGLGVNKSNKFSPNQMIDGNYCPGGSSSGSATSVYANLVPLAVGTDTAGSVRIPSAWHALVGFKPTYNSISTAGVLPLSKSYDTVGTISKCVKDAQIFFNILSKNNFQFPKIEMNNISVAIISDFILEKLEGRQRIIFENIFNILIKKGIKVKKINVPEFKIINDIIKSEGGIVNFEAWNYWRKIIEKNISIIDENVSSRFIIGKEMKSNTVLKMKKQIESLKKNIYETFNKVDVFLTPTLEFSPPTIKEVLNNKNYVYYNNLVLGNTRVANIFDLCAIAMPIGKEDWLSLSIFAKENEDEKLLCIAYEIEKLINNI